MIPSAPGPECSTDDNKPGNRLVAISCPASEKKLAALILATAGLSQPPASSRSPARAAAAGEGRCHGAGHLAGHPNRS